MQKLIGSLGRKENLWLIPLQVPEPGAPVVVSRGQSPVGEEDKLLESLRGTIVLYFRFGLQNMPLDGNAAAQFENVDRLVIFSQNCQQPTVWRKRRELAIGILSHNLRLRFGK